MVHGAWLLLSTLAAGLVGCSRLLPSTPADPLTGSFGVSTDTGCTLQSLAVRPDSVRVQLLCQRGAPSYNMGLLDTRVQVVQGRAVHATQEYGGECRITFHFLGDRVRLEQEGQAAACGFGYGVTAAGELRRLRAAVPRFDLVPDGE